MAKEMSRRTFLKQGAAAAIGLAVVPSTVLGKKFGYTAPSDKLNILGVGIGGRGASVLKGLESQNIIGLCDVDWKYADHIFKRYPAAKKFNDYRKMYDEMLKSADAVMVATADHTHAIIAADAITAAYQKADPSHKDDYAKLNKEWHAKEDQLESKIKETSAKTEGLPYAATESVAWYLADDLKMTDATPKGYAQASANESEPTPADIKDFQDTLKAGFIKMFVFNSQEANSTTDQITGAAKDANVPIVELAEQMPKQYTNLLDWMSALVDQFAAAVK